MTDASSRQYFDGTEGEAPETLPEGKGHTSDVVTPRHDEDAATAVPVAPAPVPPKAKAEPADSASSTPAPIVDEAS